MALTEAERKLLAELEATLTAQDPKLASKFAQPHHQARPAQAIIGVVGVLVGLVCLVVGMSSTFWVSVAGFIIMVASVFLLVSSWHKPSHPDLSGPAPSTKPKPNDFLDRMERRWKDRQEQ